ncbi:abscission/NoCut checkpoint regulator isoform X1 [Lasioglossum baleicum]|uniref:abscission/NoCut checkpoint regulator isoform X1 n=1 Tax=Lasioglossum baleicum TaxID=434251 RepID=UPI003FCE9A5C
MSCNICQSKFSFFTKEVACPGCGFSYCGKCLKYKCTLPDGRVKKVCGRCHSKNNSRKEGNSIDNTDMSQEQEEHLAPVDITKKLDSLENPAKPPIVMYKHANRWEKFKRGLEPADQEIVDRLRKLKEEDKTTALSVDEIRKRLALLKDEEPGDAGNSKINIHPTDSRTDQEKADDLIQEYLRHLELSSGNDPVSEIQSRLRSLQGLSNVHRKVQSGECIDEDDEAHITKKLIAKALAEAALEKKYEEDMDELEEMEIDAPKHTDGGVKKEEKEDDEEEKPTCVMCDQTKNLSKCLGCYGDLYCPVCYEDNHDEFEREKHKKVPNL